MHYRHKQIARKNARRGWRTRAAFYRCYVVDHNTGIITTVTTKQTGYSTRWRYNGGPWRAGPPIGGLGVIR